MNTDTVLQGLEILLGLIIIPWNVWLGASIFSLREEVHIMRNEVDLLREIKDLMTRKTCL